MKQLGALLLSPVWDASPSQDTQHEATKMLVHHRIPSMKQLGALLLSPKCDASPSQATKDEASRSITTPS